MLRVRFKIVGLTTTPTGVELTVRPERIESPIQAKIDGREADPPFDLDGGDLFIPAGALGDEPPLKLGDDLFFDIRRADA